MALHCALNILSTYTPKIYIYIYIYLTKLYKLTSYLSPYFKKKKRKKKIIRRGFDGLMVVGGQYDEGGG